MPDDPSRSLRKYRSQQFSHVGSFWHDDNFVLTERFACDLRDSADFLFGVSLVLSDHMLRGVTGTELAAELKKVRPNVPVVLHSGAPPATMENVDCFVLKGESVENFLAIIRDLVNRSRR